MSVSIIQVHPPGNKLRVSEFWLNVIRESDVFVVSAYLLDSVTSQGDYSYMPRVAVSTECSKGKAIHTDVCILVKYKFFHWVGGHYGLRLTSCGLSCYRNAFIRRPSAVRWVPMRGHSSTWGRSECSVPYKNFRKKKSRALLFFLEAYSSTLWLL